MAAFLAQDYVAAESLDLAVREYGPAPAADSLRVATQLAGALDFAHVVDVCHGALHPRDVLLSADDTRLTGIGIAQALQKVGVPVPARRPYVAPERSTSDAITARGDVFSLAAVVYELMSGKRVTGSGEPPADAFANAGGDPTLLRRVFATALATNPDDRFATALEFVDALKSAVAGRAKAPSAPQQPIANRDSATTPEQPAVVNRALLPFDVPEASDRADIEMPVASPEFHRSEHPSEEDATDVAANLPLAAAEEERYEEADSPLTEFSEEVAPETKRHAYNLVTSAPAVAAPIPSAVSSVHDERRGVSTKAVVVALIVGLGVGFAGGYGVGSHQPAGVPAGSSAPGREFTDAAVKPEAMTPKPDIPAAAPKPEPRPDVRPKQDQKAPSVAEAPGHLLVRSTPSGARVSVDGKDAGMTPAVIRDLAIGSHHVRLSHDGFAAVERRVVISRGRPSQSLTIPLERERTASRGSQTSVPEPSTPGTVGRFTGGLYVDSRPTGAKVFVDGKLVGTTPLAMASIAAGEHAVRLEYDGYRRWTSSVRIIASEQNKVTASLER